MKKLTLGTVNEVSAYICDRCGRDTAKPGNEEEGFEFVSIDCIGGYDSIFGDQSHISIDLCQYCLKETLGPWLRISGSQF